MGTKKFRINAKRFYSAHHTLLRIAKYSLVEAEAKEARQADWEFSAITLSSLAIEAFCNAVGERVIDNWSDFESCNPMAKIRLISEHLNINYDSSEAPWDSVVWLSKMRNRIVHPKAEPILYQAVISEQEHRERALKSTDAPKSRLEKEITLDNAIKSIEAVNTMIALICEKLTPEQKHGISDDTWGGSVTAFESHD